MIRTILTLSCILLLAACAGTQSQQSGYAKPCMHACVDSCCEKGACKHCKKCSCCSKENAESTSEKPCKVCEESERASQTSKKQ